MNLRWSYEDFIGGCIPLEGQGLWLQEEGSIFFHILFQIFKGNKRNLGSFLLLLLFFIFLPLVQVVDGILIDVVLVYCGLILIFFILLFKDKNAVFSP